MGNSLALVTGLYSAAIRSAHQPAGSAGWIELFHYSLMPLSDFAPAAPPSSSTSNYSPLTNTVSDTTGLTVRATPEIFCKPYRMIITKKYYFCDY
jgi:hypothetical protein